MVPSVMSVSPVPKRLFNIKGKKRMATIYQDFTGIASWCKLDTPDEYLGDKRWCLNLGFDEESRKKFDAIGSLLKIKTVVGGEGVTFRRDCEKKIKGELVTFDPPRVEMWDKEEQKYVDFDDNIGNESKVKVNVQFYDTVKGRAHRLCSVTVLEHTPYNPPTSVPTSTEPTETSTEEVTPW